MDHAANTGAPDAPLVYLENWFGTVQPVLRRLNSQRKPGRRAQQRQKQMQATKKEVYRSVLEQVYVNIEVKFNSGTEYKLTCYFVWKCLNEYEYVGSPIVTLDILLLETNGKQMEWKDRFSLQRK